MSDLSSFEGVSIYELLRYILPGQLIMIFYYLFFLTDPITYTVPIMLLLGIIIGFLIHSLSLYKYVPGSYNIRKVYHENVSSIFKIEDIYLRYDLNGLAMTQRKYAYFRKYQALGAFKLDACFLLMIPIFWFAYNIITKYQIYEIIEINMIFSTIIILILMYHLRDDGLNDLKRAFNLSLLSLIEYSITEDFKIKSQLISENEEVFIKRKRKRMHPLIKI